MSSSLFVEGVVTQNYVRCAISLVLCAAGFSAARVLAAQPSTPLTAAVLPDGKYSKVAVLEMGREAAHILKRSGVSLRWHVGAPTQAVSGLLVVVRLVGECDMDGAPAFLASGPLGWAHESDGSMIPFSDLACDNLRGSVQAAATNQLRGNVLLGRAMGRVLAHELYHIVADTSDHGKGGVAQAALSPRELTAGVLELRSRELKAMQTGLTGSR